MNNRMKTQTAIINISLPASLKKFAQQQVKTEHYSNMSDFMRTLIREYQKQQEMKKLESMLLEGLASGPGVTVGTLEWEDFWKGIYTQVGAKRK